MYKGDNMKLLHLSDLHIGKRVNEFSMLEDQKYILVQILSIAETEQVDGVILAGDIYDKPIPPAEAVLVFDGFLTKLADMNIPVFVVSGNHDSAERLAFGAQLMNRRGIYLSPVYEGKTEKICLTDSYGEVFIHLLPFIKPAVIRHTFQDAKVENYQDAVQTAVSHMDIDTAKRNILVAHQFVTGASRCESEEVTIGGIDNVEVSVFDPFDYVALGHIHSPQHVGRETVRYCGTPLKYSFSEAEQQKSVTLVELKEKGETVITSILLKHLRDLRKIRGKYMHVTSLAFYQDTNTKDYVQITLTDEEDIPDVLQKLRAIYPNIMRLEYDNKRTKENRTIESTPVERKSELELFGEFYELQNNQPMSKQQQEFVHQLIKELI